MGMISLYVALLISFFLSNTRYSANKVSSTINRSVITAIVVGICLIIANNGTTILFDNRGMLAAIILSVIITEFYIRLTRIKKIQIDFSGESVPPAVLA